MANIEPNGNHIGRHTKTVDSELVCNSFRLSRRSNDSNNNDNNRVEHLRDKTNGFGCEVNRDDDNDDDE